MKNVFMILAVMLSQSVPLHASGGAASSMHECQEVSRPYLSYGACLDIIQERVSDPHVVTFLREKLSPFDDTTRLFIVNLFLDFYVDRAICEETTQFFASIPDSERVDVSRAATTLLQERRAWRRREYMDIANLFAHLPSEKRSSLSQAAATLAQGHTWTSAEYALLLKNLGRVPNKELAGVVDMAKKLIDKKICPARDCCGIVYLLFRGPHDRRVCASEAVEIFASGKDWTGLAYGGCMSSLACVPNEEQLHLANAAHIYAQGKNWAGGDYSYVMDALAKIPKKDRIPLSHIAAPFTAKMGWNGYQCMGFTSALARIPQKERTSMLELSEVLVPREMIWGHEYASLIYALARFSHAARAGLVDMTNLFATEKGWSVGKRALLINTLATLPRGERAAATEVISIFAGEKKWTSHDCMNFLRALVVGIDEEARAGRADLIKTYSATAL